jgi:hypothetical protein
MEARPVTKPILLCLLLSCGAVYINAKTPPKAADFSGNWILDTAQTKNMPDGLVSYTMAVKQETHHLEVQTRLKGDLRKVGEPDETSPQTRARVGPPGGSPGGGGPMGGPGEPVGGVGGPEVPVGRAGTMGGPGLPVGPAGPVGGPGELPVGGVGPMSGPGVPVGGGPMGEGIPGSTEPSREPGETHSKRQTRTALAFSTYPQTASYQLGGKSNVRLRDPGHTQATAKVSWTRDRKQLRFSLAGDQVTVKDQWTLSKDGRELLIDRTVHAPGGSTSIHLVFEKEVAGAMGAS